MNVWDWLVCRKVNLWYEAVILPEVLIPNSWPDRLVFVGCGGFIAMPGVVLLLIYRYKTPTVPEVTPPQGE